MKAEIGELAILVGDLQELARPAANPATQPEAVNLRAVAERTLE
ncbi:hypothetical protein ABZY19_38015 [Streptomyces sp. NPDC006475]